MKPPMAGSDELYDGVLLNIAQREAARGGAPALLEVFLGFLRRRTGECHWVP